MVVNEVLWYGPEGLMELSGTHSPLRETFPHPRALKHSEDETAHEGCLWGAHGWTGIWKIPHITFIPRY